jgi:hypothetical protein
LRLSFQPTAPWRNELTLSYKGSDASISLTDKLTWPFLVGNLSVETTATWREKKLEGSVIGSYGQHLTQGWDLGAEVGYILRANSDDFRQGIFGGISINVSF